MSIKWPEHKASMSIDHNEHIGFSRDIEDYVEEEHIVDCFISDEDKQRCIELNEIWEIQWYPRTPLSYSMVAASTFELALKAANELQEEE